MPGPWNICTLIAVANTAGRNFTNAHPQWGLIGADRSVLINRAGLLQQGASPPYAHFVIVPQLRYQFPLPNRLQSFFDSTSWSRALSRLRSVTMRLRRKFPLPIAGVGVIRRDPFHHTSSSNGRRLLAHAHFAADLINRCTQLLLTQGKDYLLLGKFTLLHGKTPFMAS